MSMGFVPSRIIRYSAYGLADYASFLIRRDVSLPVKIYARDVLSSSIPSLLRKYRLKFKPEHVVKDMARMGFTIPPPKGKSSEDLVSWFFDVMRRGDDEDLFQYFRRIGLFCMSILSQYKLTEPF